MQEFKGLKIERCQCPSAS